MRLKTLFTSAFSKKNQTVSLSEFFNHLHKSSVKSKVLKNSVDYLNAFQVYDYIGSNAATLAESISMLEYRIMDNNGNEIEDPKIEAFLQCPCVNVGYDAFVQAALLHLILDGNIFAIKSFKNLRQRVNNQASSIQIVNPAITQIWACNRPIVSTDFVENSLIDFYEVNQLLGGMITVLPADMIHIKTMGPHNMVRGMGKIQSNSSIYDQAALTASFQRQMLENGGFTRLGLKHTGDKASPEQTKRIIEEFRERYEGSENMGITHFYPPGYEPVFPDQKLTDMEMLDTKKLTKQDIANSLNIPALIAGLETKYNDQHAQFAYYNQFTLPRWGRPISNFLTQCIQTIRPDVKFKFVYPFNVSDSRAAQLSQAYESGVITGNEYRSEIGFDEDDANQHLNTYYIGFQKLPADISRDMLTVEPATPEPKDKALIGTKAEQSEQMSLAQRKYFFMALKTKQARIEPDMMREIKGFYREMEKRIITGLEKSMVIPDFKAADVNDMFNAFVEKELSKNHARRMFTSALTVALNDFNGAFDSEVDTSFKNPVVRLVVEQLGKRYEEQTMNSRLSEVRGILQKNLDEGGSVSQIKSDIQAHFETLNGDQAWRALRIAKTEASYAYDRASLIGWDDLDYNGNFDIVGCEDMSHNCNRKNIPRAEMDSIMHHPNHTGVMVPATLGKFLAIRDWKGQNND